MSSTTQWKQILSVNYINPSELFYFASSASLKVESQGDNYKHLAKRMNICFSALGEVN